MRDGDEHREVETGFVRLLGNTLTSGNQTFDYCVAGNDIMYKETTAKAIPAVFTLTK